MDNKELLEKAKGASSPEELIALAKENGLELSEEYAAEYLERLNKSDELSDEELDNVSGGGCFKNNQLIVTAGYSCEYFFCKYCCKEISLPRGVKFKRHSCIPPLGTSGSNCQHCSYHSKSDNYEVCTHPNNNKAR